MFVVSILFTFLTQNLKFLLWITADPRSLALLVGQNPFKFYIACNFVLSVALNSKLLWADAYVNSIFAAVSSTNFSLRVEAKIKRPVEYSPRATLCELASKLRWHDPLL